MNEDIFSLGEKEETNISQTADVSEVLFNTECVDIDEFYDVMVKNWREGKSSSYEIYLQQGNIPSVTLYKILGLSPFAIPNDDDVKRIESWKNEWMKEAEKFQRIDLNKKEDIVDAVGSLAALFLNKRRNEEFTEVLKQSTWGHLSTVISEKCSDGVVELYEMASILNVAKDLGLLTEHLQSETLDSIKNEINNSGAKIQTIDDAFEEFFKDYTSLSTNNIIDNETNRTNLYEKYKELIELENIVSDTSDLNKKNDGTVTLESFLNYLKTHNLSLKSAVDVFTTDYFNKYKTSHNLSQPLSAEDYGALKAVAVTTYGLTNNEWNYIESANNITIEKGVSQKELDVLKSQIEQLQKQNTEVAVQPQKNGKSLKNIDDANISPKSRIVALMLCLFLGPIGVHRFYVGRVKSGIMVILVSIVALIITAISLGSMTGLLYLWTILDFIFILAGKFKDKRKLPVKKWF